MCYKQCIHLIVMCACIVSYSSGGGRPVWLLSHCVGGNGVGGAGSQGTVTGLQESHWCVVKEKPQAWDLCEMSQI